MGIKWLAIGGGEPTEWPHLKSMVNLAMKLGLKVAVTTNGVRLEPVLQTVDRVQVSHDKMHAEGSGLPWHEREAQVLKAVKYYGFAFCPVGLNTMLGDEQAIGYRLLDAVDNITLVLPKPVVSLKQAHSRLQTSIDHCKRYIGVCCVDSCLACLNGDQCYQGRSSMAIDQRGMASICSNAQVRYCGSTLSEMWEAVRCKDEQPPAECLLEEL
jgi:MoaA/NifB/PqqE/SkfB family radical SAM enzyme